MARQFVTRDEAGQYDLDAAAARTELGVGLASAAGTGSSQSAFDVPNGWYYRINGSATIDSWIEFR